MTISGSSGVAFIESKVAGKRVVSSTDYPFADDAAKLKSDFLAAELPVEGFDEPYTPVEQGDSRIQKKPLPVIILIHGIRTEARWQKRIAPILAEGDHAIVYPVGYDRQNVFEFLLPGFTRRRAIEKILWRLNKAIGDNEGHEIVIIAHSFGTYCFSEILKENPRIRPARVLLCGSRPKFSMGPFDTKTAHC